MAEEGEDGEDGDAGEHPGLPEDEELAAVEDVGGGSGEKAEQEDRKAGGGLHEGDEQRRGGERCHEPGAGCVLHPSAEVGDGTGDPAVSEERDAQGRESADIRWGGGAGGLGRFEGHEF